MKIILKRLFDFALIVLSLFIFDSMARAQNGRIMTNVQLAGTGNQINSGGILTVLSGADWYYQAHSATTNDLLFVAGSDGQLYPIALGTSFSVSSGPPYTLNVTAGTTANPSAKVGPTAVNGSATSVLRSDAAPAIDLTAIYPWTGLHSFALTSTRTTSGIDYGFEIVPILNQRNTAGFVAIFENETVTQAGTGTQWLMEMQVGGADKFVVDATGAVIVGTWGAGVIASTSGGAGAINGILKANGSGVVTQALAGTDYAAAAAGIPTGGGSATVLTKNSAVDYDVSWQALSTGGTVTSITAGTGLAGGTITTSGTITLASVANGTVLANVSGTSGISTATTVSNVLSYLAGTRGDILELGSGGWTGIAPSSTSGYVLTSNGTGADPTYQAPSGAGVSSITGTAHEIIASASTGAITLSTPQGIDTTSNVQHGTLALGIAGASSTAGFFEQNFNSNAGTPTALYPSGYTIGSFHVGTDSSPTLYQFNAYGSASSHIIFVNQRGTQSSPSALQTGDSPGELDWGGYGASAWATTEAGKIAFAASQNWTNTAHGMAFYLNVTPNGSTTSLTGITVSQAQNLIIGGTGSFGSTDNGNGAIQLQAATSSSAGIAFGNDTTQVSFYRDATSSLTYTGSAFKLSGLTLTTGSKSQARYFPLTIGGTAVNVLTD